MVTLEWVQAQIEETLKGKECRQTIIDLAMLYIVRDHLTTMNSFGSLNDVSEYLRKYTEKTPEETKRAKDLEVWSKLMGG